MTSFRTALSSLTLATATMVAGLGQAEAGGYVGLGVGSSGELEGDIQSEFQTSENTDTGRFIIGQRIGFLAVEASYFGTELQSLGADPTVAPAEYTTHSLGVELKYHLGLVAGLEAYGKLGLNKTWLATPAANEDWDYSGRGHVLGGGLQYRFELPLTEVALWVDYSVQDTMLRDGARRSLDGQISMLNLGASIGF